MPQEEEKGNTYFGQLVEKWLNLMIQVSVQEPLFHFAAWQAGGRSNRRPTHGLPPLQSTTLI